MLFDSELSKVETVIGSVCIAAPKVEVESQPKTVEEVCELVLLCSPYIYKYNILISVFVVGNFSNTYTARKPNRTTGIKNSREKTASC